MKARPPAGESEPIRPIRTLLDRAEADEPGEIIVVEQRPARAEIAPLLEVAEGAPLVMRQRLVLQNDIPREFITLWLSPDIARTAGLDQWTPLTASVRQLIQSATGRRFGHVTERLTARRPTSAEYKALGITRNAPVLGMRATVADTQGQPVLVVDLALPGELYEFTDVYAL
jgi:DNA-binding GntR family transcriptional regulator